MRLVVVLINSFAVFAIKVGVSFYSCCGLQIERKDILMSEAHDDKYYLETDREGAECEEGCVGKVKNRATPVAVTNVNYGI